MVASGYASDDKVARAGDSMTGPLANSTAITAGVAVLADNPLIEVDVSQGNHFRVTLGGNWTLANPVNLADGQKITFEVIQDSTGGRTLTYGSAYAFGTSIPQPVLTVTPGKRDFLGFCYSAQSGLCYLIGLAQGF
jgi:hypothetical protein